MKSKKGFVSNSSSSSIIVKKEFISDYVKHQIDNHISIGQEMEMDNATYDWAWSIEETENGDLRVYNSIMDNFDMGEFLTRVGLPEVVFYYE
jgi:hypothetical protein